MHYVGTCPWDEHRWAIISLNGIIERTFLKSLFSREDIEELWLPEYNEKFEVNGEDSQN